MSYTDIKRRDEALDIESTQATVRVIEITNEADELEGYGVINGGYLHPQILPTRSMAHALRETLQGAS